MDMNRLKQVQPPPLDPIDNQGDWENVSDLGDGLVGFPTDYKKLIERYGTFGFGDFIWVLNPFAKNPNIELANQMRVQRDALATLARDYGESIPHPIGSLVPWFITDNGDVGYWIATGDCETWRTVVNAAREPQWFDAHGTSVRFLCDVMSRTITVPFFPEDFPQITA